MKLELVTPGTPIKITKGADGRRFVNLPNKQAVSRRIVGTSMELPDAPERTNPIALVLCYDLLGLPEDRLQVATGFTADQIGAIRESSIYIGLHERITNNIRGDEDNPVKAIFKENAEKAARILVEQLDNNSSSQAVSAATKILSYAGLSPKNAVVEQDKMKNGLNIIIVDSDPVKTLEHK